MDHESDTVRVQSPFARPREPRILVALAVAFLLLALLKPWSFGEGEGTGGRSPAPSTIPSGSALALGIPPSEATPSPTPDPNAMDCLSDRTEQVVVLERWPGKEVRSWVAFPEVAARGPLDDRLSPIPFFSSHVVGLGICSSGADPGGQRSAARFLDVQSILTMGDGPVLVDLGVPDPITRALGGPDAALLYGPPLAIPPWASVGRPPKVPAPATQPPAIATSSATWPTGSYAIAFSFPSDAPGVVRWLRIDLVHGAGPSG